MTATGPVSLFAPPAAEPERRRTFSIIRGQPEFDDPQLTERFAEEDRVLTLRNVRNLCWIAMILVPAAVVLDWFAYPNLLMEFLLLRVSSTICLIPVQGDLRRISDARRNRTADDMQGGNDAGKDRPGN